MSESLGALPIDHPLRNTPLIEIGAEYRWERGSTWKKVLPTYAIARCTYNQLGEAWTRFDVWRSTTQPQEKL